MTIYALVSGTLHRDPTLRTSKTGKAFVTALLRSEANSETTWMNSAAFDETAQAALLRLKAGESVALQGSLKARVYEKDGAHRLSLDVVAAHVLALRLPKREKPKDEAPCQDASRTDDKPEFEHGFPI